ncbi:MAG: hypothetical protein AMJ93_15465 [Anaerolineae bacterium SM23_84]|jgi:hypothetical protein|nr:MAG: hypothetical protein AMJ93_15465 [Anaerolineae bacterium SM23_84]
MPIKGSEVGHSSRRCPLPTNWQDRLERARELYLAGDIRRGRHLEEKWTIQVELGSLHPLPC